MTHPRERAGGWLAEWSFVSVIDDMLPPRHPNDGEDDDDEEDEDEDEEEPAVIREPDE